MRSEQLFPHLAPVAPSGRRVGRVADRRIELEDAPLPVEEIEELCSHRLPRSRRRVHQRFKGTDSILGDGNGSGATGGEGFREEMPPATLQRKARGCRAQHAPRSCLLMTDGVQKRQRGGQVLVK